MVRDDDEAEPDPTHDPMAPAAPDTEDLDVLAGAAEVRAALNDDDLLEPDVYSDDDDDDISAQEVDDAAAPRKPRRLGLAPTLLLVGGGAWAVALAMRCSPAPLPSDGLAVPAAEQAEPEAARTPPAPDKPTPASDGPKRPPAAPPTPTAQEPDEEQSPDEAPLADDWTKDWAKKATAPDTVTYTVRHGGSIKNVANLFKIYHHEILALNPGVDLDRELSPGTAVVVYRREPGATSESVGIPSGGSLEGGVPMLDGPGRVLKMIPWKGWGTAHTVATLDQVLRRWAVDESNDQSILVGNMSARGGGKLEPHSTHQSGRDVDLGYLQKLPKGEELNWREMTAENLDAKATWKLLKLLRATGELEVVFIDSKIQKLLYDWAVGEGGMSKSSLRRWMEYPRSPPVHNAIIQHVPGHIDHLHARFACTADDKRCKSRGR